MSKFRSVMNGVALSAMLFASGAAMAEGKADRARKAIAEAQGKIEAANKLAPNGEVPNLQAGAVSSLKLAREDLKSGNKDQSIAEAIHAGELADRAIGVSQRMQSAQADQHAADAAAAQQEAASANARAESAEASANAAAADAAAARAQPPVVIAPAPTVTTETTTERHVVPATKRKVIVQKARPARTIETQKTTVTAN